MRRAALLLVGALLASLTGCSGGSEHALPLPSPSPVSPSPLPTCAPTVTKPYTWPKQIPQDLPRLPGVSIESSKRTTDGLFIVQFSTSASLRDGVLFIVKALPKAGYVLGRGDAEPAEADAPFTKGGDLRGVLRGAATGLCQTKWILAVTRQTQLGTGTPLLPAHHGPSPSPLPFG
jgi:hypothetical protein